MNTRGLVTGAIKFGEGFNGHSIGVAFNLAREGALGDRGTRPQGTVVRGPNDEDFLPTRETFEIRILAGRNGAKYSWERVSPGPGGAGKNSDGGGTHDGLFAYERNGRTRVAIGAIAEATWSDVGPWLLFTDPQIPFSGPSGPGGLTTVTIPNVVFYVEGVCRLGDIVITGVDLTGSVVDHGAI